MIFYLGTHQSHWLFRPQFRDIPLFVSRRRLGLMHRKRPWRRAVTKWCLDSGGFQELSLFGKWTISARQYAQEVQTAQTQIGGLVWAAIQDWMCEPEILSRTGGTILEHQQRTVDSYFELSLIAPELPWCPVLQGWHLDDYLRHIDMYWKSGLDLRKLSVVGVGSICRRQRTNEVGDIIRSIAQTGIRVHGFGIKTVGILNSLHYLTSSDSLSWSYSARGAGHPLCSGNVGHKNCANCSEWALLWRERLIKKCLPSPDERESFHNSVKQIK